MKDSECKEWIGCLSKGGYGLLRSGKKTKYAHHVQWERHHGTIPKGLLVRHKCDNRKCINIDHLELGTIQDNSDDCTRKGRQARGFSLPQTKLSEEQVNEILQSTGRQVDIAKKFGVSQSLISQLRSGKYARSAGESGLATRGYNEHDQDLPESGPEMERF